MTDSTLVCAGKPLATARDQIRRYCGLPWSGGEPETWAYENFDLMPTGPDDLLGPPDYLAAAVIHPGFASAEMTFFRQDGGNEVCRAWLSVLPRDVDLADADEETLDHLTELSSLADGRWLSILSKVTHRKRPRLVPLFDRATVDRYRPITRQRGVAAWPSLVRALQADLATDENRQYFAGLRVELTPELMGPVPSDMRLMDIAVWMEAHAK